MQKKGTVSAAPTHTTKREKTHKKERNLYTHTHTYTSKYKFLRRNDSNRSDFSKGIFTSEPKRSISSVSNSLRLWDVKGSLEHTF